MYCITDKGAAIRPLLQAVEGRVRTISYFQSDLPSFIFNVLFKTMSSHISNVRPPADLLLAQIADYVCAEPKFSDEAYETARYCLLDTLGCGILALNYEACTKLLGPVVAGDGVAQLALAAGANLVTGIVGGGVTMDGPHPLGGVFV